MSRNSNSRSERFLYWLGVRMAGLVIAAMDRLDREHATLLNLIVARGTLEFVSVVGWTVDRLPAGIFTAPALTTISHHGARS